jgi:hypothetical protein
MFVACRRVRVAFHLEVQAMHRPLRLRFSRWLLPVLLSVPACRDPKPGPVDDTGSNTDDSSADDTSSDDTSDTHTPDLPYAGEDLDEGIPRELAAAWELPDVVYDALDAMGLDPATLSYPDAGATFRAIPTRLHWTDTLRHEGLSGPTFAHMVAEDVRTALAAEPSRVLREMIAAQSTYLVRDSFVTTRYDERVTALDAEDPLLAALRAFYEHAPVEGNTRVPEESWAEIEDEVAAQVLSLPEEARLPLALGIQGLVRVAELRDEALTSKGLVDMETWEDLASDYYRGSTGFSTYSHPYGTEAFPGVDFVLLTKAAQLCARVVEDLRVALATVPHREGALLDLVGPLGRVAVAFDDANTEWQAGAAGYLLALDAGGNDTWIDHFAVNTSIFLPVSVLLDLAGDDVYRSHTDWEIDSGTVTVTDARSFGAGLFGIALLDDASGDDRYHASGLSQGMGVFGAGLLLDHGGSDTYESYYSGQGAADFGYGLLLDLGADADRYETLQMGQGYGGPMGMGWLVDEAGDDAYEAISDPIIWDWAGEGSNWSGSQGFGYGVREGFFTEGAPIYSGGLGALFDLEGDDDFTCAVMCQGFGYAFGTGLFFDAAGNDDHLVTHKYALGSATHWAAAVYLDLDGHDTYRNDDDDECIGEGYDASTAWHLDLGAGDDTYVLDWHGEFVLGVARHPALGVLLNEAGDDVYAVPGDVYSIGRVTMDAGDRSSYLAGVPALAMFLDLGGKDLYEGVREEVGNGAEWVQTEPLGGGWDASLDFGYGLDAD